MQTAAKDRPAPPRHDKEQPGRVSLLGGVPAGDLPIADYALLGDCHSAALVSRTGSVDWCCLPRFDGDSCFARLLDREGGCFAIGPLERCRVRREYLGASLVLVTTFESEVSDAALRLIDFFAMRRGGRHHPRRELVRIVEGLRGQMAMRLRFSPRLEYGAIKPWLYRIGPTAHCAVGSNAGLMLFGDIGFEEAGKHDLAGELTVQAGQRLHLGMRYITAEELHAAPLQPPPAEALEHHLEETLAWWREWADRIAPAWRQRTDVVRSAVVLKALTYAPTGAIVAAPTTSLPEHVGGPRNWDYRYSWIRDSVFTVRALAALGCAGEADGFRRFIQRSAAGSGEQLKALVALDGRRRLTEIELGHLAGWRGSRPVRIGNGAEAQFQADKFGLLLEVASRGAARGFQPDEQYWEFLRDTVEVALRRWREPDAGIWEVRSQPRHHVHSKAMCWAAAQRGIELAERYALPAPLPRWRAMRDEIRAAVETHGVDATRNCFVAVFGSRELDAALLLLPDVGFVPYDDPRMLHTAEAIRRELDDGTGLTRRYLGTDGLPGPEGAFLACSFWLAECLARQGRQDQARDTFERACRCANDLGLYSEEYDGASNAMLGNYPQGLTHLAHIAAALALDAPCSGTPAPAPLDRSDLRR